MQSIPSNADYSLHCSAFKRISVISALMGSIGMNSIFSLVLLESIQCYRCFKAVITNAYITGNGYITVEVLKEILREIDSSLNEDNLEQIVDEVDEDGSGTVDFDEFMAMMTGE